MQSRARGNRRERAEAAYEAERAHVSKTLKELAGSAPVPATAGDEPTEHAGGLRRRLLDRSVPGTDAVFDLIEALGRIDGIEWSYAPKLGFRGSVTERAPKLARNIGESRGTTPPG